MIEVIFILGVLALASFGIAVLARIFGKRTDEKGQNWRDKELDQRQSPVGVLLLDIARTYKDLTIEVTDIKDDRTSLQIRRKGNRCNTLLYFTHWRDRREPTFQIGLPVANSPGTLQHCQLAAAFFPEVVEWAEEMRGNLYTNVQHVREGLDLLPKT